MDLDRRNFLRGAAVLPAAATAAVVTTAPEEAKALQREPIPLPPNALGLLYDSTLCVGCKACVAACKEANNLPPEIAPEQTGWNPQVWDSAQDLSAKTYNIIKAYLHGTMAEKDRDTDGFAFIKRQCLHCLDPSCVSACPVTANAKDPDTGIVKHDPKRCIGCRYCVYACPFGVPKYDYNNAFGEIKKCQLCQHRLKDGKMPACADACPTGATLFGRTADLKKEAERRVALKPGDSFEVPRGDINKKIGGDRPSYEAQAKAYKQHVYGASELGGTQVLYLSAVSFDKLGLPTNVPDHSWASESEGVQHTIYKGLLAPAALLAGLLYLAKRNAGGGDAA